MADPTCLYWDPLDAENFADPVRAQSAMRLRGPLAWTDRNEGFWSLFTYSEIAKVVRDPGTFAQGCPQRGNARPPLEVNPPLHTAYRSLLWPYFNPSAVDAMEADVRSLVVKLLQPLIDGGGGDLAPTFTYALPTQVVCRLLHLPAEGYEIVNNLSSEIYRNEEGREGRPDLVAAADADLAGYAAKVVSERRRRPLDRATDLISGLLAAEIDGRLLTDAEVVEVLRLVFVAGHNSTTSALGNCFLRLATLPEVQERLRADRSMVPKAVTEFLRLDTPVMAMPRTVTQPVRLAGQSLDPGDQLWLVWASGNRDEEQFDRAGEVDLDRARNAHLAFGRGIHACIGRGIAELELRVACEELLARTASISLEAEPVRTTWVRYGVSHLPLRLIPS